MSNDIHVRRAHRVFIVAETVQGTLVAPASANLVVPTGLSPLQQTPTLTESKAIRNTLDVTKRFVDRYEAGSWSLPCYMQPSGSAGSIPQEALLMESLLGVQTINAGASVAYSQAIDVQTFSLWIEYDNTVRFAKGCSVDSLGLTFGLKDALEGQWAGKCMSVGTVGTQDLSASVEIGATSLPVDDASCYSVGGLVELYDVSAGTVDNNSDAGYAISAVDTDANTITVPAIGAAFEADDVVRPWLPAGTEVGAPIENKTTVIKIDTVATDVKAFSVSIDCPKIYDNSEITTSQYPETIIPDRRTITGTLALLMRNNDARYFVDNYAGENEVQLTAVVGTAAGSIFTLDMPICHLPVPDLNDSAPTIELSMSYMALGDIGEDSLTATYT